MTKEEKKLIQAYKDYINFLTEAYDQVFQIAKIHGYCCSKESVEKGEMMRMRIAIREMELEVSSDSESEKKMTFNCKIIDFFVIFKLNN